jgi:hypothetical protein
MVVTNWLRLLSARLQRSRNQRPALRKRRLPVTLARSIESLEERALLSGVAAMTIGNATLPQPKAANSIGGPRVAAETIDVTNLPTLDVVTATSSDWLELAGNIATVGEIDTFNITVAVATGLFLDIDTQGLALGLTDSVLEVRDTANALLGLNDDGFDFEGFDVPTTTVNRAIDVSLDSSLYIDLAPGSYQVIVRGLGSSTGDYVLRMLGDSTYTTTAPVLDSNAGAANTLYLDFDGYAAVDDWGAYNAVAFDFSGNTSVFTPGERLAMRNVWAVAAEDYAPFDLNVTTVSPGSFNDGSAYRMVMTNSPPQIVGQPTGTLGVAFLGSYPFFGPNNNVGFTFTGAFDPIIPDESGMSAQIMAQSAAQGNTVAHEFGHAITLEHYATLPAPGVQSAIMSIFLNGLTRKIFSAGTNVAGQIQNDVAIAGTFLSVKPDDYGNTTATATNLTPVNNVFTATGILESLTDLDVFQFDAGGDVQINVDVNGYTGDADVQIRLLNSAGTVVAIHDPTTSFSAFIAQTLAAGTYFLEVASDGQNGELGTYSVNITATQTPTLTVTVDPPGISEAGGVATVTVTRNNGSAGDLVVTLTDITVVPGPGLLVTLPPTVTILNGQTSATFSVTAIDDLFPDGTQVATIRASATGLVDGVADVVIFDDETAALTLSITPGAFSENGGSALATITRNSGTLTALTVTITNGDPTEASMPTTVTFAAGQSTVSFVISGVDDTFIDGTQTVNVTAAALGHASGIASVNVLDDEALSLTISPAVISEAGGVATVTITRNLGTVGAVTVFLTNSDPTRLQVPASVVIPNGQASVTFQVTAIDNFLAEGNRTITITATSPTVGVKSGTILIVDDEVPTVFLTLDRTQMSEAGGFAMGTVRRNTPAIGNLVVQLFSSDTTEATVPVFVVIPDGSFTATFIVSAVDDTLEDPIQSVTITATALGHLGSSTSINVIDNDSYHVQGTSGNDLFFFYAGEPGQSHVLRVNGKWITLDPAIRIVRFMGGAGQDELRAFGSLGNDNAYLIQNSLTFTGPGFEMYSHGVETNRVTAGRGANQEARFRDGAGNDQFIVSPKQASLAGNAFWNYATGFNSNIGVASRGGRDSAIMQDSAGGDAFVGQVSRSRLQGTGFHSLSQFFEFVDVRGSGGYDQAELYDSAGADVFTATAVRSILSGLNFSYAVTNFDRVQARGNDGFDTADMTINGSADQLVARNNVASLIGGGIEVSAFGFNDVTVSGGAGFDAAYLYDSTGNDFFTGAAGLATLQGTGYIVRLNGFELVSIYGYFGTNRKSVSGVSYDLREFGTWIV